MLVERSRTDDHGGRSELPARRGRIARVFRIAVFVATAVPAVALLSGFFWFLWRVPTSEIKLTHTADGIVVLTGGASRVTDALELLATGRGRRLLITGVHRATGTVEIARIAPKYQKLVTCCVDLDRSAINTVGNATETRRWVSERNFRSLIVVTSNYHMPRAMAELGNQLPDVMLIPYPVVAERRADTWAAHYATARLLLSEYLKYMVAVTRMRLDPVSGISQKVYSAPGPA